MQYIQSLNDINLIEFDKVIRGREWVYALLLLFFSITQFDQILGAQISTAVISFALTH